ncbi:DUF6527 family protein [Flavobacterium phragmitis]|uniref:Uncharacterized protein n=1 Tax=Flavobacterium phragmitis TaxID=739143 RepID=A0A1I1KMG1_9FLAO|nr:DUF6527 family protein [Flavobacterium phragmitis]SFC59838.1 hypothetical protein SAMN05216297_101390 [Flavobacterium phragmitis]
METIKYKFVTSIPDVLEDCVLYISMEYGTAIHKCVCGCGNEVVTPFSPTDWDINYDGESVSLNPSIGNWGFECQSHYWIIRNKIIHSPKWDKEEIEYNRGQDKKLKARFYEKQILENDNREKEFVSKNESEKLIPWWKKLVKYVKGIF